jgi:hypothetical protein
MEISAVYTTIPSLIDISLSGHASEVADTTSLDGTQYTTSIPNGNTKGPTITANAFYDPDDTTHQAFIAKLATPVATNFKLTRTDATPLATIWSGVGFGFDENYSLADAAKCTFTINTSGAPS